MTRAVTNYRSSARGETTKRLIAQLVNEGLVTLSLLDGTATDQPGARARITGPANANTARRMILPVVDGFSLSKPLVRPNDFGLPVTLCTDDGRESKEEDDPGSIFAFSTPWFRCDDKTASSIIDELRNSAVMLGACSDQTTPILCYNRSGMLTIPKERWMQLGSNWPILDIDNSSFLDWERCLIMGHPTHPVCCC